jgi:hypothetical protein
MDPWDATCNKLSYELNNRRIDAAKHQGAISYAHK